MVELPGGTVTFLFTDLEGSTRAWEHQENTAMQAALARHDEILTKSVESQRGVVVKTMGDGVMAAFAEPGGAVQAAVEAQRALAREPWDGVDPLVARMGIHAGPAEPVERDYLGAPVNRAARIMSCAHGGQIVLSAGVATMLRDQPLPDVSFADLGIHRLRDLREPEQLFQVVAPGLHEEFPPLRSLDAFTHNLPVQSTSFIGRERDLADVTALLTEHRLVTLTGVGGSGKTRLALEVAARHLDTFRGGVFLVDLTPLGDPDLVVGSLVDALKVPSAPGPGPTTDLDVVLRYLASRKTLIILDNCEHLIDACAELVDRIVTACPDISVLATSRETLEIDGEQAFRVSSLDIVTDGVGGDAVDLFLERARAARPNFDPHAHELDAIGEICRRLDGIPLAIELAASRVAHMAPTEIAGRLDDRFRLLTGRQRRRVQRQQTLEATMDWSWDLLEEPEKRLLRRLAVFSGGCTLEAAEEVCDEPAAVDLLAALVDKSLVVSELTPAGSRYRLLETVRMYAEKRLLDASEVETFRHRHREWYRTRLSDHATPGEGQIDPWVPMTAHEELDNVRGALEWSWLCGDLPEAAQLAMINVMTSLNARQQDEAAKWLAALFEERARLPADVATDVAAWGAYVDMTRADFDRMRDYAQYVVDHRQRAGDLALSFAYCLRGLRHIFEPGSAAREDFERGAEVARGSSVASWIDTMIASLDALEGQFDDAIDRLRSVIRRNEESLDEGVVPIFGEFPRGELAVALVVTEQFEECLDLFRRGDDFERGSEIAEQGPFVNWASDVGIGLSLIGRGRIDEGRRWLIDTTGSVLEVPLPLIPHVYAGGWVGLALAENRAERAAELLAVQRRDALVGGWRSPAGLTLYRHQMRQIRSALEPAAISAARDRAEVMPSVEEILEEEIERAVARPA